MTTNPTNPTKYTARARQLEVALLTDYLSKTYTLDELKLAASILNKSAVSFYADFNKSRAKLGRLNRMKANLEAEAAATGIEIDAIKLRGLKLSISNIKCTHRFGLCTTLAKRNALQWPDLNITSGNDKAYQKRIQQKLLSLTFLTWASYSGDSSYPIDGDSSNYHYHIDNHSLYPIDKQTISSYSRLRIKLLTHIINTTAFITRPACRDIAQLAVIKSSTNTYKHSKKV